MTLEPTEIYCRPTPLQQALRSREERGVLEIDAQQFDCLSVALLALAARLFNREVHKGRSMH